MLFNTSRHNSALLDKSVLIFYYKTFFWIVLNMLDTKSSTFKPYPSTTHQLSSAPFSISPHTKSSTVSTRLWNFRDLIDARQNVASSLIPNYDFLLHFLSYLWQYSRIFSIEHTKKSDHIWNSLGDNHSICHLPFNKQGRFKKNTPFQLFSSWLL